MILVNYIVILFEITSQNLLRRSDSLSSQNNILQTVARALNVPLECFSDSTKTELELSIQEVYKWSNVCTYHFDFSCHSTVNRCALLKTCFSVIIEELETAKYLSGVGGYYYKWQMGWCEIMNLDKFQYASSNQRCHGLVCSLHLNEQAL